MRYSIAGGRSHFRFIQSPAHGSAHLKHDVRGFTFSHRLRASNNETKVSDRFSMMGRTVLVTGGGRGMGFAIAKAIAQEGGNVAVLDVLPEPVPEFNDFTAKYGTKAIYKRADITQKDSLELAFTDITNEIGNLNGCVTAAGICIDKPLAEHGFEESQRLVNVNIMGTFWPIKLIADHMAKNGEPGSIVMIASIAAHGIKVPEQNLAIYNMSKAAVKGLAGPLAVELAPSKIRINSISPGPIITPMTEQLKVQYLKYFKVFESSPPLARMGSADDDIAPAALYLLSDASKWVTGIDVPVTGGVHAGVSVDLLRQGTASQ